MLRTRARRNSGRGYTYPRSRRLSPAAVDKLKTTGPYCRTVLVAANRDRTANDRVMLDSPQSDARSRRVRARGWYRLPIFHGRQISLARANSTGSRQNSITPQRSIQGPWGPLGPLLRLQPGPYALAGSRFGPKHTHLAKVLITDSTDYQNRHDAPSAAAPLEQPDGASHFRESPEPLR
jgi:hypothetical protein